MSRALTIALALFGACGAQTGESSIGALPPGTWRGDVAYPGLPAIGVHFVVGESGAHMIAAPNMGFAGGALEELRAEGDSIRFSWALNGDSYACALRRQQDGVFLGPCESPGEPTIGVRMVPPGIDVPTGLARTLLEMSSVQWVAAASAEATTVHVAAQDRARVAGDDVIASVRLARADNAALFGDVARTLAIDVFFSGTRERMAALVGRPVGGWTDPMAATVALVGFGENEVALRHEVSHAISFSAWGPPHQGAPWLAEGLATWLAGACQGYSPHDLAADLHSRGELLPLRALVDEFQRQDDIVAYLESGSIVGWLIETRGANAFRRVWSAGLSELDDTDDVERDWLSYLEARPARPVDWTRIRDNGCG